MRSKKFVLAGIIAMMIGAIVFGILIETRGKSEQKAIEKISNKSIRIPSMKKKILERTGKQIQNTFKEELLLDEDKIKDIYDDFIYNTLYKQFGCVTEEHFLRELADSRISEYSPITNMWYKEPLQSSEKGVVDTYMEDLDGDDIPELIVTILVDSGEYYTDSDGNSMPKDAWIELRAYRITDGKVVELEQNGDQNCYLVCGIDYRGTWCCFNVQSDIEKYVMVLSLFSNGRFEASFDCRASVFQIRDDSFYCLYSKKVSNEGLTDLNDILLDERNWTGNLYPMSPDDIGDYGYELSDELKKYYDLSGIMSQLFAELGTADKLDIDNALPESAQAISEINIYSTDSDSVEYSRGMQ